MKYTLKMLLAAVAAALMLAACGSSISHGTVERKSYTAGHFTTKQVPIYSSHTACTISKKKRTCHTTRNLVGYSPERIWHPAVWELYIKNKKQAGWVTVTQTQYNQARDGHNWHAAG